MISYAYENLFKQDSVDKQIAITFENQSIGNEQIDGQNFTLTQSLCSETQLKFGCCEASKVEFTVGYGEVPLENKTISVYITPNGGTALLLGSYRVVSDVPTADRKRRQVTAYDKMYDLLNMELIDWYDSFWVGKTTATIKQFRDALFDYLDVEQAYYMDDTGLLSDTIVLTKTVMATSLSGKDILCALCETGFTFGHITPCGKFEYIRIRAIGDTLYPAEDLYPANNLYPKEGSVDEEVGVNGNYISATYEDYFVEPIDRLTIRMSENDIGYNAGFGYNAYVIEGNFLLYGQSTEALAAIYGTQMVAMYLASIFFVPADIVAQGNPCLEVGDRIRLHTRYATIDTYILQRTLTGIQALRDEYVAESPRLRQEEVNGTAYSLIKLMGKSNELTRTIDETKLEMTDIAAGLRSYIDITAGNIESRIEDIQDQLDGASNYYEGNGEPTMLNFPYWDFTTAIPCDGTIRLDEIYNDKMQIAEAGDTTYYPFFYVSEADRKAHLRDLYIDLDTGNGYRFVQSEGVWIWQIVQDSDFSVLFNQLSIIRQEVDSISTEVSNTTIEVADHETRITQNSSQITQQATQIESKVSKGSIISTINQSAEQVSINAGKINLNGAVTANSNVTIGQDGKITAVSATLQNSTIYNGNASQNVKIEGGKLITYNADGIAGVAIHDETIDLYKFPVSAVETWAGKITSANAAELGALKVGLYARDHTGDFAALGFVSGSTLVECVKAGKYIGGGEFNYDGAHDGNVDIYAPMFKTEMLEIGQQTAAATALFSGYQSDGLGYATLRVDDVYLLYLNGLTLKMSVTANEGQLIGTWYGTLSGASDERVKKDIKPLSDKVIEAIGRVELKEFTFADESYGRTDKKSIGAIAQDVLSELNDENYGIVSEYKSADGEQRYALNYNEFLVARNAYLEKRVDELEERIARLEALIKGV